MPGTGYIFNYYHHFIDGEAKCPVKVTAISWQIRDVRSGLMPRITVPQAHPESCYKHLFHRAVSPPSLHSTKLLKALLASLQDPPLPFTPQSAGLRWALEGHASPFAEQSQRFRTDVLSQPNSTTSWLCDVRQANSPSESQFPHLQNGSG